MDSGDIHGAPEEVSDLRAGDAFMLAEFENMRYFHQEETAINERRVDILLAVASGAAAGIVLLAQVGVDRQFLLGLTTLGCAGLLVIGIPVFVDTLRRDITAVDYIRALNRVRAYFISRAPDIGPYLLMPTQPQYPPYGDLSSSRRASAAINSAVAGIFFAALRMLEFSERDPDHLTEYVAAGAMVIVFVGHLCVWRLAYARATRKARDLGSIALTEAEESQRKRRRSPSRRTPRQPKNA